MDVRANIFDEALPGIKEAINKAVFGKLLQWRHMCIVSMERLTISLKVAIDFEFSGVSRVAGARGGKQSIQDRYTQDRIGVEKYQVLQMGLCTVEKVNEPSQYICTYKGRQLEAHERTNRQIYFATLYVSDMSICQVGMED
jgi:hypothetical protein